MESTSSLRKPVTESNLKIEPQKKNIGKYSFFSHIRHKNHMNLSLSQLKEKFA